MAHIFKAESTAALTHRKRVDGYFDSAASYWREIYHEDHLLPLIYRERQQTVLHWIDQLALPTDSHVLEVGCGAGLTSIALARQGHRVCAIDSSPRMIEITNAEASAAKLNGKISTQIGDAHSLAFRENLFHLVVSIGIVPWLHSEAQAILEMERVLRPGGFLILTADNEWRLNFLLDPLLTPVFAPLRRTVKNILQKFQPEPNSGKFHVKRHTPDQINSLLAVAGLRVLKSTTVGFGPFTFLKKPILPDRAGIKLHRQLTRCANRGTIPGLKRTGLHYLVMAQKPS